MKIVEIRDAVVPIASDIRNAYIDFSKMTASIVAVVTDVIRDGKPVVGYGFNSNGRYGASEDLRRIEAVIAVTGAGRTLAVDANGRFDLETAIAYAEALAPYDLFWYEEAGDPLDYALQAELARHYDRPMATGENLFSHQDARNLLRYGRMRPDRDWLQFDCALSYGLVEYLRTLSLLPDYGFSPRNCIPHGGHQMSLNIAAGLHLGGNESYPGVFAPFDGFADDIRVENSYVRLPDAPGIGFEEKAALIKTMRAATQT
ncbi:MAG: enolase C-terminal domain-like protein [Rhodomicrobiaceae bacterium]